MSKIKILMFAFAICVEMILIAKLIRFYFPNLKLKCKNTEKLFKNNSLKKIYQIRVKV